MAGSCIASRSSCVLLLASMLGGAHARWPWEQEPEPPPPPPLVGIDLPINFPTLMAALICWVLPLVAMLLLGNKEQQAEDGQRKAVTGAGTVVNLDIERRKEAESMDAVEKKSSDRKLQLLMLMYAFLPIGWAWQTQENPTVGEQVGEWASLSWTQLTDGRATVHFQLAFTALCVERACYTWVHTFSSTFVKFCETSVGRAMGKKPLDVVLTIFYINKVRRALSLAPPPPPLRRFRRLRRPRTTLTHTRPPS